MYVLSAKLTFYLAGADSLKDKRQIRRSLIEKIQQRYNMSVSEVEAQDVHQTLVIGVAIVSGDLTHAQNSLDNMIRFIEGNYLQVELISVEKGDEP